jgi:hypothetical protein
MDGRTHAETEPAAVVAALVDAPARAPISLGRGMSPRDVLRLQGSAGNAAVARMLAARREEESGGGETPAALGVAALEVEDEAEEEQPAEGVPELPPDGADSPAESGKPAGG